MLGLLPEYVQVGLQHLGTYKLNDQDITAMYAQERNEAVIDMGRRRSPFLPSPADQGTLTLKTGSIDLGVVVLNLILSTQKEWRAVVMSNSMTAGIAILNFVLAVAVL